MKQQLKKTARVGRYADEPHPNDEFAWKGFWVRKMYEPGTELLEQDRVWIHRCWLETKARWNQQ